MVVVVTNAEMIEQRRAEGVVPSGPSDQGPFIVDLTGAQLRRQPGIFLGIVVSLINGHHEVVFIAQILIEPQIQDVGVAAETARLRRRQKVTCRPRRGRFRKELEPLQGQRISQPRIVRADHIRSIPVAAHELIADYLSIHDPGRRRVVDRDQVPVRIHPIAKVALPLFKRGDGKERAHQAAADSVAFPIDKEESFVSRRPCERQFDRPSDGAAKVVLEVERPLGSSFSDVELIGVERSVAMVLV